MLSFKRIAAVALTAGVLFALLTAGALAAPPWSDAPNSYWVDSYGVTDTEVGIVADGYKDNTFRPTLAVSRGQFAKMAVRGLAIEPLQPIVPTFRDVPTSNTFYDSIEGAYDAGLVGGYAVSGGLEYRPGISISRQQTSSILARYLAQIEIASTGAIHGDGGLTYGSVALWYAAQGAFYLNYYLDAGQVAADHSANTAYLVYHGIVQGSNGRLSPTASLARSQAAVLVLRVAAKAAQLSTVPPAPTGLSVVETGGKVVVQTAPAAYAGNDPTPQVRGTAIVSRPVALYDSFGGANTKLTETASNAAGLFYADLTTPLADGTHRFTAVVSNAVGQVSLPSTPVDYLLDTVAPTGAISAPVVPAGQVDAAVSSSQPEFTVTATDERSGVQEVVFRCATAAAPTTWITISTDYSAPYAAAWGAVELADGQYLLQASITDVAGNSRTLEAVPVTVDTIPPTAQIAPGSLVPEAGWEGVFYTENRKPVFGAIGVDAVGAGAATGVVASGVAMIEFLYAPVASDPADWEDFSLISDDLGTSGFAAYDAPGIPAAGLPEGHHLFAARATDRAGNTSLLASGDPATYLAGVTREVVIDATPPTVAFVAPIGGELVAEDDAYVIRWTLSDVSPPDTVALEYSLDGGENWSTIDDAAPFDTSPGSYEWTVPDVAGDQTDCRLRVTAVDKTGTALGNTAPGQGHHTQVTSGTFTIYDSPTAPTNVLGEDPDTSTVGVDWRDFGATWTISASLGIVKQEVYLLPSAQTLVLAGPDPDLPVATFNDRTTAAWVSTDSLAVDSRGADLDEGEYKIWIVVTDGAGRFAQAASEAFTVASP